ncbi:MAG: PAS domain S-box protein [Pseudomonadota bacterium]
MRFRGHFGWIKQNGTKFPIESSLFSWEAESQTHYSITIRDITLKKRAEEEQARLAAAVEQAYEAMVITDKAGTIQYVNSAFETITGYIRSEVLGKKPSILKSGKHAEAFYQNIWQTIMKGEVWRGHFINKHKNGTLFQEEAVISPLRDARGDIINFISLKRDVTQELKLEQLYRQAQKMEAMGTLAGGIAHDFNNILAAIIGYTELAEDSFEKPASQKDYLHEVLQASDRATDLVKQILTFSRQTEQEIKPVSPGLIIKETLKLLRASLPATIEIRQTIKSNLFILGDPTQMHQIVMNLCTNAGHAMKEKGGVLAVSLDDMALDKDFVMQHPGLNEGRHIRFSVSDTGCGISSETIDRIFEPFFTTKKTGEGTGLGLSVVHGIVKKSGGDIVVTSEEGKGTTFTLYFPVVQAAAENAAEPQEAPPRGQDRILVVDDEPAIAKLARNLLEGLGYCVTAFTSSTETLEAFRSNPQGFDIIMTDYTMPNMTGAELAKHINDIRADIPVILCTGYSDKISEEQMKELGIKACIKKPFHKAGLGLTMRSVLEVKPS